MALRWAARGAATRLGLRFQVRASIPSPRRFSAEAQTSAAIPHGLKFLESHEWIKVEDETGTIGITDHAQGELGDVVFAELPDVGTQVTKGKNFGVVESVKACSDVYSPVTGEVVAVNEQVKETPALVNKSPFEEGWLIKVKLADSSELGSLMDAAKYEDHVKSSAH